MHLPWVSAKGRKFQYGKYLLRHERHLQMYDDGFYSPFELLSDSGRRCIRTDHLRRHMRDQNGSSIWNGVNEWMKGGLNLSVATINFLIPCSFDVFFRYTGAMMPCEQNVFCIVSKTKKTWRVKRPSPKRIITFTNFDPWKSWKVYDDVLQTRIWCCCCLIPSNWGAIDGNEE